MSLSYKKIDGGECWIYRFRLKYWQLLSIALGPMIFGYLAFPLPYSVRVIAVLFGISFAFVYGMSSLPLSWHFMRAMMKKNQQIVIEKKDGYYQYLIKK